MRLCPRSVNNLSTGKSKRCRKHFIRLAITVMALLCDCMQCRNKGHVTNGLSRSIETAFTMAQSGPFEFPVEDIKIKSAARASRVQISSYLFPRSVFRESHQKYSEDMPTTKKHLFSRALDFAHGKPTGKGVQEIPNPKVSCLASRTWVCLAG